jgi:hypothetical protein
VGYLILILLALVLIPVVYMLLTRRAGNSPTQGQRPIDKPVMVSEPAADEPTPAASSIRKDTSEAQRRIPPS